jgi:hypothetical protein
VAIGTSGSRVWSAVLASGAHCLPRFQMMHPCLELAMFASLSALVCFVTYVNEQGERRR